MTDFELVYIAFAGWCRFPREVTDEELAEAADRAALTAHIAIFLGAQPDFEGLGFEVHAVDQLKTH